MTEKPRRLGRGLEALLAATGQTPAATAAPTTTADSRELRRIPIADIRANPYQPRKEFRAEDLASGRDLIFAAAGVTDGDLMKGVRFFGDGTRTSSLIMQTNPHRIRFIDSIQVYPGPAVKIRF